MKLPSLSRLLSILLVFSTGTASAQSLADLLSSIQERKRAVQQSRQVAAYLPTMAGSSVTIPDQQLIEWTMLPNVDFPADGDVATLGIEDQVALLNQAIVEFRHLNLWYMNLRPEDLTSTARLGALRPYLREDFPEIGRADATNYHALLSKLAENVMRLRVLAWPFAGKVQTKVCSIHKWEQGVEDGNGGYTIVTHYAVGTQQPFTGWEPASLGEGSIPTGSSGLWESHSMASSSEVAGWQASTEDKVVIIANSITRDHSDGNVTYPLHDVYADKITSYHTDAALFAKVPSRTGDQLGGKVALLTHNSWSPAATGDVSAPASWDHGDAGYQIVAIEQNATASTTLADDTQITVNLAWFACDEQGYDKRGLPSGFTALKAQMLGGSSGDWDRSYERELYNSGSVTVLQRTLHALCAPDFVQGLNAGSHAQQLAKSETLQRPPAGDASPVLHPVPGMLVGLPLGVGLEGNSLGWIGVTSGDLMFNSHDYPYDYVTSGIMYPAAFVSYVGIRFDYASNLRFCGPAQDFHVVYNTSRDPAVRGSALPSMGPTPTENASSGYGKDCFMSSWDLPRLRQIVSRDLIADVTTQGHYQNTVKIYRRSRLAGAVDRTPGHLETPDPTNLIRTLVFANPDAGSAAYPSAAEKIHIADGSTTHKIWQGTTGVFEWPYSSLHFKTIAGTVELFSKTIDLACDGGLVQTVTTAIDGLTTSVDVSFTDTWDWEWGWWSYQAPDSVTRTAASVVTTLTNTFDDSTPGSQDGFYPATTDIDYPDRPDVSIVWKSSGVVGSVTKGPWSAICSTDGDALKVESFFNNSLFGTTWTTWSDGGRKVKTQTISDGSVTAEADWSELEYGDASGTGLPGLPHVLTRKDGSGMTWGWTVNTDGSTSVEVSDGLLASGVVTHGTKSVSTTNARGYLTGTESFLVQGTAELKTGGRATPEGQFSDWGAPLASDDFATGLESSWAFEGNLERLATSTSPLGLATTISNYDALGRVGIVSSNGIIVTNTFTAFSTSAAITGNATGSMVKTRDALGRLTSSNNTWNGVTDNLTITPNASPVGITRQNLLGTHNATIRQNDGSIATVSGPTLPFDGTEGSALSVDVGLFKSTTELGGQAATYQTTWTDAWGRVRKTETPAGTTDLVYSDPDSSLKRGRVTAPTGRNTITESDPYNSAGAITRSGIDVNGNGSLGASDRYVESVTTVVDATLVTTLSLTEDSGLREILRTVWTPSGDQTVTKINRIGTTNDYEETITRTPNYTAKTVETASSKGWSKNETLNNLGLTDTSILTGTGIPTTTLDPTWGADGSLSGVSLEIGGATHSATFNPNGTLATLTAPGRGNILSSHGISGGVESLTVDGVTHTTKLDGTQHSTSGTDIIGKTDTLGLGIPPLNSSGFQEIIHPAVGADTTVDFNAAGAPTAKSYAAGDGEIYDYTNGLLHSISLARGGELIFGYSDDGAKDLTSATWPTVASDVFTIPAIAQDYGYDRAGRMDEVEDSSGVRSIIYQNGRLKETTWISGTLSGYKIVRGLDDYGRDTGFTLYRGSAVIHSVGKTPNGVSGEVSTVTASDFSASLGRDAACSITSITRNSVIQRWQRGTAGRILLADTNGTVSGAPSFNYKGTANDEATAFDAKGRRLKCATAGNEWTYQYTNGQLTSAVHPTLGTFAYQFDGIGRRTENSANTTDLLNRTLAWTNSQSKTLKVTAHPDAHVWLGVDNATPSEIPDFTGTYNYTVPSPGAQGGWVAWNTLAVLEGEGDEGANPDAKAAQSGAVWVPPTAESFTYDAAGNRESSALWDYGWDAKNELVHARTKNHNTAAQGYDVTNDYDAEGRRFSKKVNRYQNGTIVEQKVITFLHDGNDIIYERHQLPSGLTILERKYVWGPDISGTHGGAGGAGGLLLIRETKGNTTTDLYPLYDGTGHVIGLATIIDNVATLVAEYAYGPFGELIHAIGPYAQSNPFRYTTKYFDAETGLYCFGRRFLDPVTGQWLSREPLGESESVNLYAYTGNDPINHVDELGLAEHGLLYQFFFGLDPITLEPSTNEKERQRANQQEALRFIQFVKEFESGQMDTMEFPLAVKEAFVRQQAELNKLYQQQLAAAEALANGPQIRPVKLEAPIVATAARSIGGATTEFNASINSDWLLPTGAGTLGAKFAFGGLKSMLPILAAGARTEARLLTAEMRAGEMLSSAAAKGVATRPLGLPTPTGVASEGGVIRTFAQQGDQTYYRVFSGDQQGSWLTAVPPKSSAWAQEALALPSENTTSFIQEVLVPAGTQLQRSRALPAFGRGGGAEQFKLLEHIPDENFGQGIPFR